MTAIVGKVLESGILIMADKRVTYRGINKFTDDEKKIIMLNKNLLFAYAGVKNIMDKCIVDLKKLASTEKSVEEIIEKARNLFSIALDEIKREHVGQSFDTIFLFGGFKNKYDPFACYFSSNDHFQKSHSLSFFYKTFPHKEMPQLRNFLIREIDYSVQDVNYFIPKFFSAITSINDDKVGSTAYAVFLSRKGAFEVDIDIKGEYKVQHIRDF
ncbi:hypothetical protein A8F95_19750 [Bacillus wudalianchiensis]|uniref:Uncharacterized protein n=2 Tax=Pseudobacillus wudalianchiensis TaxID=1743143 RepID=A0A1B9B6Q8_9BACI|nr:hypothetical protein A8F95_19750 [Bacillus wudalianchiensis]